MAKQRRNRTLGAAERYTVIGPAYWKRSFHTSESAALAAGHACSQKFPDAICRVEQGLPGLQRTIAECNRNECWRTGSLGKRKHKRKTRMKPHKGMKRSSPAKWWL